MSDASHAVFLSYASQDADAAQKICDSLRAAGIEVFLDQTELRGGDAWDQKIRHEIQDCALFVPIISQHTQERLEGYFRHEWNLAIERTHHMAQQKRFLVPVVVDGTVDHEALVPDPFRAVQWTRLPGGETPPVFVERIKRLLSPEPSPLSAVSGVTESITEPMHAARKSKLALLVAIALIAVAALAYFVTDRFRNPKLPTSTPAVFAPPPHSIAVLPFVNLSGDKSQEYFSDGLTEELLNSLSEIDELQVAARTSAFSFKGTGTDIGTIARKLNVAAILEGSVRRSEHTIRVTAQLIDAASGFHLWSKTYDRDAGDVLKLQTEIATAVASALKVALLGDVIGKIELGGTHDPAAFDAYLRGSKALASRRDSKDVPAAIALYTEAIRLDPNYALAFAARSGAFTILGGEAETAAAVRAGYDNAKADAREALILAPNLGPAHAALAIVSDNLLDFRQANDEYARALELAPGNADTLRISGQFAVLMGNFDAGVAAARRAVVLDPLARASHSSLGATLYFARRYEESVAAFAEAITLDPDYRGNYGNRGLAYYRLGNLESARATCEIKPNHWVSQQCLAVTYERLGLHQEAEAKLAELKAERGDTAAYQYATIYAQWGNLPKALDSFETALQQWDPGLANAKTDPLLDPLRKELRFLALMRELKFPN